MQQPIMMTWPSWRTEHLLTLLRIHNRQGRFQNLPYLKTLLVDCAIDPPGGDRRLSQMAEALLCRQPLRGA